MTSQHSQKLSTESSNSWCLQVDTEAYQAAQAGQAGQKAKHKDGGRSENLGGHSSNRVSIPVSFLHGQEAKEYGADTDLEVDTEAYQGGQEAELEVGQKFSTSNSNFELTKELIREAKQDFQETKYRDSRGSENLVGHTSNRLSAPVSFLYGQEAKQYGAKTDLETVEMLLPLCQDKQAGQVGAAGQEANHRDGGGSKNFRGDTSNRLSAPVSFLYEQNLEEHVLPVHPPVPLAQSSSQRLPKLSTESSNSWCLQVDTEAYQDGQVVQEAKQAIQEAKHWGVGGSKNLEGQISNRVSVPVSFLYGQKAKEASLEDKQYGAHTDLEASEIPLYENVQVGQVGAANQEAKHRDDRRSENFRVRKSNRLSAPVSFLLGQNLEGQVLPVYPSIPPALKQACQAGQEAKHRDSRRSENLSGHTSNRVSVPVSFLYGQQLGGHVQSVMPDLKQSGQEAKQACQSGQAGQVGKEAKHRDSGRSENLRGSTSNRLSAPVSFIYEKNLEEHVLPVYPSVPPVLKQVVQGGQEAKHRNGGKSEHLGGHTSYTRMSVPVTFQYGQQLGEPVTPVAPPVPPALKQDVRKSAFGQEVKQTGQELKLTGEARNSAILLSLIGQAGQAGQKPKQAGKDDKPAGQEAKLGVQEAKQAVQEAKQADQGAKQSGAYTDLDALEMLLPLCGGANGQEAKQAGQAAGEKDKQAGQVVTFDPEAKQADQDDQVDAPGQVARQKARKKAVQKDDYKVCKNMCCSKSQDFDPCNPCDWAASLLSLAFFLIAFYVIKEVWLYCNIPTVPDLIGHVLTEYVLD
jgi:hypothetical protein